jgi:histidinol dehydrogenase
MTVAIERLVRFTGAVGSLDATARRALFDRTTSSDGRIRADAAAIIAQVRAEGDVALRRFAERFDGVTLDALEVPRATWRRALDGLDRDVRAALERAARNIARVHEAFRPSETCAEPEPGIVVRRRPDPLSRVGVYAPGGRAAYPSSVLMAAIPARVAGVGEVIVCSPPDRAGLPSPLVLAAAEIAGADRVFALGGAGAVAAMALGTASVPRVDRIVGPGNAYVAEAKLQLCGNVGIDSPAGPSELLLIADASADPRAVAIELLAQAEHDPLACVVAVTIGAAVADGVLAALSRELSLQPRRAIIEQSLVQNGAILVANSRDEAITFANEYAAEHLALQVAEPDEFVPALRNGGTVFAGRRASVAFGDYMTGANHVLPTGGLARSYSGLSTLDFVRWTTIQTVTDDAARSLAPDVARFAEAERLPGHAAAARAAGGVQ